MQEEQIKLKLLTLLDRYAIQYPSVIWQDHFKNDCTLSDFKYYLNEWIEQKLIINQGEWIRILPPGKSYLDPLADVKEKMTEQMIQADWAADEDVFDLLPKENPTQTPRRYMPSKTLSTIIQSIICIWDVNDAKVMIITIVGLIIGTIVLVKLGFLH